MWIRAEELYPEHSDDIKETRGRSVPEMPHPSIPVIGSGLRVDAQLNAIQQFIEALQYNHIGKGMERKKSGHIYLYI